jgi:hypothetical protein
MRLRIRFVSATTVVSKVTKVLSMAAMSSALNADEMFILPPGSVGREQHG